MTRTALRLEPEEALPALMARRLEPHRDLLVRTASWEKARTCPDLRRIEDELEAHLQAQTLRAYHCTRESEKGFFARRGLRLTSLPLHQAEFLAYYGARFTEAEREDIKRAWADYFPTAAPWGAGRDGMVWACLCLDDVLSDGVEPFFEFFGGEAVFMPLKQHPTVSDKLRSIGEPVVVELALSGESLRTFRPLAQQVLSRFQQRLAPETPLLKVETRIFRPVGASEVLRVVPRDEFLRENTRKPQP